MLQIDIATVLTKLNDTYDDQTLEEKYYGIKFIDRNGNVHEVECRKNVKSPQLKQRSHAPRGKAETNLKLSGTVMVRARDAEHPITPKACMIFQFRDYKSLTWLNVLH